MTRGTIFRLLSAALLLGAHTAHVGHHVEHFGDPLVHHVVIEISQLREVLALLDPGAQDERHDLPERQDPPARGLDGVAVADRLRLITGVAAL